MILNLNYFTVICIIMESIKQCGRNCSNFHILFDCVVMNSIFRKCYYITLPFLYVSLRFSYFQNDLANGTKFGVLPPDLSFQCLSGFEF